MRILMLSDVYFPRVNGVSTSIQTFRRELRKAGHEVTLIAPDYGCATDDESGIIRIAGRQVPRDPEDRLMRRAPLRRLQERLRAERFDIVHVQTPFLAHYEGVRMARNFGLPCVESYHTFFEEYFFHYLPFLPRPLLRRFARRLSRTQCNRLDGLIAPSQVMLDVLRGYGITTDARVIPTGLDFERLRDGDGARFRQRHGIGPGRPTLVHVGRVAFEKNLDFLLHVLARIRREIPQVLLLIAGEGPALEHLRRLATTLRLDANVLFVGYLSRNGELEDCYCAGDVFVFASHTETQGLVLLEALALGVPVVSTGRMGAGEVLREGKGAWLVDENAEDFAGKVMTVLRDQALRNRLAREARASARRWGSDVFAADLVAYYEFLTAGNR